jgi:hypothetical protein
LRNIKTVNLSVYYILLILIETTTANKMVGSKSTVVRKLKHSNKTNTTSLRLWLVEIPGWFLLMYLVLAQVPSAMNYESGVQAGVQESQEQITPIGVAFGTGCARTDVAVYIPLLAAGLIGYGGGRHGRGGQRKEWGRVCLTAAIGMTLYWTLEYMFVLPAARSSWNLGDETAYWVFLPIIALWAFVTLGYLAMVQDPEESPKQRVE